MKTRCPICKMLNIIAELKKHPNEAGFLGLAFKANQFIVNRVGLDEICDAHRLPLRLTTDITSVAGYVNEVRSRAVSLATGVRMSFEDFSNFRNANSGLYSENQDLHAKNDLLTGLAMDRAKDARKWRGAWFVAVAALGAAVIVDVLR